MNRDYFSIGTEYDSSWGHSTASGTLLPIPENKREMPCETCSYAVRCENEVTECAAFRNWASGGNYVDFDVKRLLRGCK
jgi:hypothetical protein